MMVMVVISINSRKMVKADKIDSNILRHYLVIPQPMWKMYDNLDVEDDEEDGDDDKDD